jgi:hypothetical protein
MSLRNRARSLQEKTGLSYQQALQKLRALGERPARLKRETGWPLEVCDRFLVDGHAPIDVVDVRRPTREELIEQVCETLRATANARAVLLHRLDGGILAHIGDHDTDRMILIRTRFPRVSPVTGTPMPVREDVWELDGGIVLAMTRLKTAMLIVKFQRDESSLGLVRLRMKQAVEELERLLADEETPRMPPIGGGGGPGGIPHELRVVEPVPEERPKKKPTPIGRKKKR